MNFEYQVIRVNQTATCWKLSPKEQKGGTNLNRGKDRKHMKENLNGFWDMKDKEKKRSLKSERNVIL